MPATQDSSYGPSPPTFKRQGPRKPRRARPAPSPPLPPQAAFLAAGTRSEEPALQRREENGKGKAPAEDPLPSPAPGPPSPPPPPPPAARRPAPRPRGMHPAVVAAWLPREQGNAGAGPAPRSPPAGGSREGLEEGLSLADGSFGDEEGEGNDENVPLRWGATSGADGTDALPPSVDAFFADVCPKTRGRLSSAAQKKHNQKRRASSPSAATALEDVPAPAEKKRKKRVIAPSPPPSTAPVPAPGGSWESHDLSPPPDSTVPLRFPISRAAPAPAPAFAGAAELATLSPRAKEALLRPPQKRPLELERPSASAFDADADPGRAGKRARARARAGGQEGGGGEGAARLARGQAAKGPFLREMRQTGFAPLAVKARAGEREERRARLRRKVSVKELGGQLGALGLGGTSEAKPTGVGKGRGMQRKTKGRGARPLRMGREEDAGDVLELDARAVADATRLARRLPPAHKPGIRPSARAARMRFEPVRRPAPVQAITLRPPRSAASAESGAGGAEGVANPVGKVIPEKGVRPTERAGFRFVVGVKAKRALTVAADAAGGVGEPSCAASTPTPREGGTLLSRERPPTPVTASKARVAAAECEEKPPGKLLRRVSTYAGFLLRPQREETDPLVSGVTQQLVHVHADGPDEDSALVSEQQSDNANDEHASSHSHRGGSLPSPLAPLALPAPAPAVPGPGPAPPALLVSPTPSAATLSFPSVPPAQQPRPVVQSTASSFALSARAALSSAGSSSAERMLHPPDLLFPAPVEEEGAPSLSSSSGLELRLPTRTSGSVRGWSADSLWSVGPTMESEEPCPSRERTEDASESEAEGAAQDPPTSALRSSPLFAQAQRDDDEDGYFEAAEDDPFAAGDIPFTDLAVAARTRQMLRPEPRPAIARQAKPVVEENAPRMAPTPPESTKKPVGSRRRQLMSLKG
ncbi:hypothetical protein JCM10449v2_007938 [Rhodotorula kratochvilovae]